MQFGSAVALDGVTWELKQGQTKAIIGPNGAGKSTFFNVLSGVLEPSTGRVIFDDEEITDMPLYSVSRQGISKTFQTTNLFWEETVFENVRIAAQAKESVYDLYGKYEDLTDVTQEAERILTRVDLEELADQRADELPYGAQRKLEIGVALATDPEVLLLDEPTAGMEPEEMKNALELFNELDEDSSLTIAITEHDMDLILNLADEITVLHQGQILFEGPPEAVVDDSEVQRVYVEGT